jgi:hypothetical protein
MTLFLELFAKKAASSSSGGENGRDTAPMAAGESINGGAA